MVGSMKVQTMGGKKEQGEIEILDEPKLEFFGVRHTLAFLGFLAASCVYAMRVNLSVAIVAMVNKTVAVETNETQCPFPDDFDINGTSSFTDGEFDWDEQTQGIILGSFFYGYLLTNLLGGRAAERFGGCLVVGLGVVLTGVLTMLSPIAARSSDGMYIAIRVLEGCAEGIIFPGMNTLIADYYPPAERTKFTTIIFSGIQFGTVVTLPVSGWLCDTTFMGGWPSVFYIFGGLGVVWGVFWFALIKDDPRTHPRISEAELKHILKGCPNAGQRSEENVQVPWKSIFTSRAFWVIAIMHFGYNWGFYTLLTELPTYLDQIQHFNIKKNGVLSAMPYLGAWIFGLLFSAVTDRLIANNYLSILSVRKLAMSCSGYIPMCCLVAMCFVKCHSSWALAILILSGTANGANPCGYLSSHADISPRFAGTLMGLTNTIATIPGFAAPAVTGAITQDNQTLAAWRTVFLISALMYGVTVTIYVTLYKNDVQPWNEPASTGLKLDSLPESDDQKKCNGK